MSEEKTVQRNIARGASWSIGLNFATRGLGLISIIILTRLITPYDLGIYAAAAIIIELVNILTEVGIYPVLIQHKNPNLLFYQTAWTVQVIRGVIIFLIVQLFAEYFIHIYTNEQAIHDAIKVITITVLLNGFSSIYLVNFEKEMDFKKLMIFQMICRIIGFIVTIIAAYILQSFWALVIGTITGNFARLILSHIYAPGPHRITLKSSSELLNVSRWIMVHQIGSFISLKSDVFLITRFLGPQTLGIYEIGYELAMAPTRDIAMPISRALFPGLSKLQESKKRFSEAFTLTLVSIIYITLPACIGMIIIADPLVTSLFPENWHDATQVVQLIVVFGLFRMVFSPCISALMGGGYMELNAKLTLVNVAMRISALTYGLIYYGFEGLLIAAAIAAAVQASIYITVLVMKKILIISLFMKKLWRALFSTLLMVVILKLLYGDVGLIQSNSNAIILVATVITGCIVYIVSLFLMWIISGKPTGIEKFFYDRLSRN